ncbi:MAG: glycosyltransferase family 1 protein, partial [bacterium]|nr:glycosyltransferase family 1 protein [bacterium]
MKIGITNSLNLEKRTGVEEYVYQILKHFPMVDDYGNHQLFYHDRQNLKWPFKKFWTQIRLSWEMLKNPLDILFIPAHTFPIIHPKLIITIHGLEYENVPKMYSWYERLKLRFLTKRNAKKAKKIIVPSQSVKNDLIRFYQINPEKIFVVYHGVEIQDSGLSARGGSASSGKKYILYLGGGHKRKNIEGLKKAYEILREKYPPASPAKRGGRGKIEHELVFAGVDKHVSEEKKWELLKNADIMVYPSLYEGFGFPPLEAQSVGVPVVSSNISSLPEILASSALLVNPYNPEEIAEAIYRVLSDENLRNDLIKKGRENVKRFSWSKCAQETLK